MPKEPWFKFYKAHVPEYIDYPQTTMPANPEGSDPWLYTGDMSVADQNGYFYPREIAEVLYEHPKILKAAAVSVPVAGKSDRIKIYIVLKPGKTITEEEFITFCQKNLAPYKVPKFVEFRDELPKTLLEEQSSGPKL